MEGNRRDDVSSVVFLTGRDSGRVVSANQSLFNILGLPRDEVIGKTTVELGIWRDEGQRNSFLSCLEIEGSGVRYPLRFLGAGGRMIEAFAATEILQAEDGPLLLSRLVADPLPAEARLVHDQDEAVLFLSRSATKFLVDEGTDFYQLVVQELRTLIPNSLVVATIYDAERSRLVLKTYSAPESLADGITAMMRGNLGDNIVSVSDSAREAFLRGELFELQQPVNASDESKSVNDRMVNLYNALGVASHHMIGLTWNGTIYGAVGLLIRPPDVPPNRTAVEAFVRQASVALQRNERSRALQDSLHEKETLLREIHHRVKNNLQIVASLLKLQGGSVKDAATLALLGEAADRVQSMALVHMMLYDNRNLSSIDASDFLRALVSQIIRGGRFDTSAIGIDYDLQSIRLDPDHAVPVGLIVNELVTNALKYGMPESAAFRLSVSFRERDGGRELSVADSGGALPDDFKLESSRTLGMQLVASLARQLRGTFSFSAGGQTVFRICFPA